MVSLCCSFFCLSSLQLVIRTISYYFLPFEALAVLANSHGPARQTVRLKKPEINTTVVLVEVLSVIHAQEIEYQSPVLV